jgi:hypothetical protein
VCEHAAGATLELVKSWRQKIFRRQHLRLLLFGELAFGGKSREKTTSSSSSLRKGRKKDRKELIIQQRKDDFYTDCSVLGCQRKGLSF